MVWAEYFRAGGPYVYVVTAIALFAILFSAIAFLFNFVGMGDKTRMVRMTLGGVTLFMVLASFAAAVLAYFIASSNTADALEKVDAANRALFEARSRDYIRAPFIIASVLNAVPFLIGVVTFVRGIKTPKP